MTISTNFWNELKQRAKQTKPKIILPESQDLRILKAASQITSEEIAQITLIGKKSEILNATKQANINLASIQIYDPQEYESQINSFSKELFEMRKSKGLTEPEAKNLLTNYNYIANFLVLSGEADAIISGSNSTTADTIRPALQILKSKQGINKISSFFLMLKDNHSPLIFADCAIQIEPNSEDLTEIAYLTAKSAESFGIKPSIAFLSFSTNGSAQHPKVDLVKQAFLTTRAKYPELDSIGEIQADAAIIPEVLSKKFPEANLQNQPNIFIFPDLNAGNISYKLVERLGQFKAIGPILQGLNKPVNDLSRGCSVQDIVDLAIITSIQTQPKN